MTTKLVLIDRTKTDQLRLARYVDRQNDCVALLEERPTDTHEALLTMIEDLRVNGLAD